MLHPRLHFGTTAHTLYASACASSTRSKRGLEEHGSSRPYPTEIPHPSRTTSGLDSSKSDETHRTSIHPVAMFASHEIIAPLPHVWAVTCKIVNKRRTACVEVQAKRDRAHHDEARYTSLIDCCNSCFLTNQLQPMFTLASIPTVEQALRLRCDVAYSETNKTIAMPKGDCFCFGRNTVVLRKKRNNITIPLVLLDDSQHVREHKGCRMNGDSMLIP
jgi:hypothetical protein